MPKNRISKRKDGLYVYAATAKDGGRRWLYSRRGESLRAFSKRCDALDAERDAVAPDHLTMDDLFELWAADHLATKSPSHQKNINSIYYLHLSKKLGRKKISDLTTFIIYQTLQKFAASGCSRSMVGKLRQAIAGPFAWAVRSGLIQKNPCVGVRLSFPRGETPKRNVALTDDEISAFLSKASNTRFYALYVIMLYTGLRPSEALGIKRGDVFGASLHVSRAITHDGVTTGKTKNAAREVPLVPQALEALSMATGSPWIFGVGTAPPTMNALSQNFARIKAKLPGSRITLYSFRTTFATRAARAGMQPKVLQSIMGHSDIQTTLRHYVQVGDDDLEAAAEIIKKLL